jgi:DNA-binding NtrC family response regulator
MSDNANLLQELDEYFQTEDIRVIKVNSQENLIHSLAKSEIDLAFIDFNSLEYIEIMKYINRYHSQVTVIVNAAEIFYNPISFFKKGKYHLLEYPFCLEHLKKFL